jgi:hypothetical protein
MPPIPRRKSRRCFGYLRLGVLAASMARLHHVTGYLITGLLPSFAVSALSTFPGPETCLTKHS